MSQLTDTDLGPILFIGIGAMGQPMSARLAAAGFDLSVSDADGARAIAVAAEIGARSLLPSEVNARASEFRTVVTMLPSSLVVEEVLTGPDGLLGKLASGAVVIDMSSSTPSSTKGIAAAAAQVGIHFLDAPVSGGVPKARTGELSIMVGGDAEVVASRRPLLDAMGTAITHVGGHGTGHAMKALNNLLSAIGMIGAAEVLATAARFGIEPRVALDVLNASTGRNQSTEVKYGRYVLSRAFDSGFAMQLMIKDLKIALDIAHQAGVPVPVSAGALEEWSAAINTLGVQADHTEIAAYVEGRADTMLTESAAGL